MNKNTVWRRCVTIDEVDPVPSAAGVKFSVEMLQPIAAPEQPASLQVTITNISNSQQSYQTDYVPVFSGFRSVGSDAGPLLFPESMAVATEKDSLHPRQDSVAFDAVIEHNHLNPGDSRTEKFELFDLSTNGEKPLPPGEYRFEDRYDSSNKTDAKEINFNWGFVLAINTK